MHVFSTVPDSLPGSRLPPCLRGEIQELNCAGLKVHTELGTRGQKFVSNIAEAEILITKLS